MDIKEIIPIEKIKECITEKKCFVLQGGAGSGKTETLKQVLEYISKEYPEKKIACITHTNLAVEIIVARVGEQHTICTIHSFLNSLIKDYKKNIHQIIFKIFCLEIIERKDLSFYDNKTEQEKLEHENYKKLYKKYAKRLFSIKGESIGKIEGKRDYDKDPGRYNIDLNKKIKKLNSEILNIIKKKDFNQIKYNDTRFDNFKDLTYGHDSLLEIASLLFNRYDRLGKILSDKYDFIFVDEYQDTHENIIDIFLNKIPSNKKTITGLFGDSMQGIYDDMIGDVKKYIADGKLIKIEKKDNYRCSEQVIDFINKHRNDEIKQEIAFKEENGVKETIKQRQGFVKFYYSIYDDKKPNFRSNPEDKEKYISKLKALLSKVEKENPNFKKLMLTNKSISKEVGFKNLYDIYNARYHDVREEIEKDLVRLQFMDLAELCNAYKNKNYNFVLSEIKKTGFILKKIQDKVNVKKSFDRIFNSNKSVIETIDLAFRDKLLKKSDSFSAYINRKDTYLKEVNSDEKYLNFKTLFNKGYKTFCNMNKLDSSLIKEEFDEFERMFKKETFYLELFSEKIKFDEIKKYYSYLNEEEDFITMHKTKGSDIENVLIVLDEFFWTKYNFNSIFDLGNEDKKLKNQKLFYVSCSRAIKNLICIKLVSSEDEKQVKSFFKNCKKVNINC